MNWVLLAVMVGAIGYLMMIILSFLEQYREIKTKIEKTMIDLERVEAQLKESEHARIEAESRSAKLEEEALVTEQQVSELHHKINAAIPPSKDAPPDSSPPAL